MRISKDRRRGIIAPLTALLLIPLIAMVAFAIDLGWIVVVQSDLQNAADSAALAGAAPLMDGYVQYATVKAAQSGSATTAQLASLSTITSNAKVSARAAAKQYAALNTAGAPLTLLDSDIEFGYTDSSGSYSSSSSNFPNTVKVLLRRDSTNNTPVSLFFGKVIGKSSTSLTASAASTIYSAQLDSFKNVSGFKVYLLPMAYDV